MTRWYRAYEGTVTDAKLGEVALVAECSRSVAIAAWHCILESAASVNDAGRFDATARRVAVILCETPSLIERVFAEMDALGMIAAGQVTAWKARQYESDNSTERSRKHRERKRHVDATLQGRSATPPETETDTEKDYSVSNETADDVVDPEKVMFDSGVALLKSCGKSEGSARSWLGKAKRDYGPEAVITMIGRAKREGTPDPIAFMEGGLRAAKARASPELMSPC